MLNKIMLWYHEYKVRKWQRRMSQDWAKLENIMVVAQMPAWKRKQIRRDIIKGNDVGDLQ